jgi:hypothetical protein
MAKKMKHLLLILGLALLVVLPRTAMAAVIVDMYGDEDGFGLGAALGTNIAVGSLPTDTDPADSGTITDRYLQASQTWSHSYDVSGLGTITSVQLEMVTASLGAFGQANLYVDGQLIGSVTDSDYSPDAGRPSVKDTFNLLGSTIDGANTIYVQAMTSPGYEDFWALDYSKLTIETAAPVPEPGTMMLLGSGMIGLAGWGRKKFKK